MINVEDITTLLGKAVVDEEGLFGEISSIDETDNHYPIKVEFDGGYSLWYSDNGVQAGCRPDQHITIIGDDTVLQSIISDTMKTHNLTPEDLISFILEKYC